MLTVTEISPQQKGSLVNVYVNGEFAFSSDIGFNADNDVYTGRQLTPEEFSTLTKAAAVRRAVRHSLFLLERRDFSKKELSARLEQKGYDPASAAEAAETVEKLGYINDLRYAERIIDKRKGRVGKKQLRYELSRAGISEEDAENAFSEIYADSDGEDAVLTAMKRKLKGEKPEDRIAQRKLFNYFISKGFDYETVRAAFEKYCENEE